MTDERRLVTVLFADVTGSTTLGESMDPEDLRTLMRRYYAIAREVVEMHDGTVEKFIGDAVMAVFGLPRAHGDDAARALAAALELRGRVRDDAMLGEALPIRLGVNTGEVVATRDAASDADSLITGDAVNVAARLQQSASPWQILCGERTARAAPGFRFGPEQSIEARGKVAPVRAMEVLGAGPVLRQRVPLLGRDDDLTQLELVSRRAIAERRPFLATLIAPPGTGKTRLLEEFLERLPGEAPSAQVAVAQCLPYGQRLTYWPLRAVLHQLVGAPEDAAPEEVRAATARWLAEAGVPDPARVCSYLASTVGAGDAEVADPAALFGAWRTFVEAAAERAPLVLVFEDLHWSSDGLLDLVEHVMQPRADVPVLMLVLTRPELLDRRPSWGAGRRNQVSLALDPLDDGSVAMLVRHLLESAPPELVDVIVTRAEGNPFYAGELVRSVLDRVGPQGVGADPTEMLRELPDTVQATVLARLDLLPPDQRRTLQLGAVLGRSFSAAGIAAVEPALGERVGRITETLLDRDMIRAQGSDRYTFRHILIREVAYSTLPRAERARLHGAAGDWMEAFAHGQEEAYAELIAYHYREAAVLGQALGSEEAATARAKAYRWLIRAAESASAAAASVETDRHLRNALELATPADHPELYERLGDVRLSGDGTVRAYATAYRISVETGRPADDRFRLLAKLLEYEMRFEGSIGDRRTVDDMDARIAEARSLGERSTDKRAHAIFNAALAFRPFWQAPASVRHHAHLIEEAEAAGQVALALARELDDAQLSSSALDGLAAVAVQFGDHTRFRELSRERLMFGERLSLFERTDAYGGISWASCVLGDIAEAETTTAEGLALIKPGQVPETAIHLSAWRLYALYLLGRWDEIPPLADRARQIWADTGHSAVGYAIRGFLAAFEVARARGDHQDVQMWRDVITAIVEQFPADDTFRRMTEAMVAPDTDALAGAIRAGPWPVQRLERFERAMSMLSDERLPVASDVLETYLDMTAAHGARPTEGQIRRSRALERRDVEEMRRALAIFESCGAPPLVARARCEMALLSGDARGLAEGIAALERIGDADQISRYEQWARESGIAGS